MSVVLGQLPGASELGVPEPVNGPLERDIAAATRSVRAAIASLVTGAFLVTMTAITMMATTASQKPVVLVTAVVVVGGGLALLVALGLIRSSMRRVDRLDTLGSEMVNRFDRVRLDAIQDPLTGLGNHRAFQEELDRAAGMARRHGQSTSLLLIDVDDLKRINDTEGHAAGDDVLRDVARVIVINTRRTDRAFRIGGDEFAVLSSASKVEEAMALGRRILATALEGNPAGGERSVSVTIGISAIPSPSADRRLLFRHADAALYWGKRHGRTDVRVYDPKVQGMADDDRPSAELASMLDMIVAERQLTPMYQPVFALQSGACVGFEGLVRPMDPTRFRNASAMFVAAESVNRTVELDLAAVRVLAAAAAGLGPERYLAVNLSPRTVEAVAFNPHEVLAVLAAAGIDPSRIVLELTEREAVEDMDRLVRNLAVFRRTGVRIAADDVGSGNAGLRLLSRVDFDVIKIDLSLVQSGAVLEQSRSVLRALLEMADRRGATTVAEGIETPIQLGIVRDLGIQVGQGYLLAMPSTQLNADPIDVASLLESGHPYARAGSSH